MVLTAFVAVWPSIAHRPASRLISCALLEIDWLTKLIGAVSAALQACIGEELDKFGVVFVACHVAAMMRRHFYCHALAETARVEDGI